MPRAKAKTATKASKQELPNIRYLCIVVIILAAIIGLGFALYAAVCLCHKPNISHLEQRELEAFESIFQAEINNSKLTENDQNTTTQLLNIGLSQNDDLYGDFIIYYYNDNHEAIAYKKGKVYLQCDHEYRQPVTVENEKSCGFAYSYEDKTPIEN